MSDIMAEIDALKARAQAKRAELESWCADAGQDPDEILRLADVCKLDDIGRIVAAYPEDWHRRLRAKADSIERNRIVDWDAAKQDVLFEILHMGDGPVSSMRLGLDGIRQKVAKHIAIADAWTPDDGGLLMTGESESGKTLVALAIAWRLHLEANVTIPEHDDWRRGRGIRRPVYWVQATKLARSRDTHRLGTESPEIEEEASAADVLVLDDLMYAGHRTDVILEVVARRMNSGLPTITTTGWSVDALSQKLGDSAIRRLVRVGSAEGKVVELSRC